MSYFALAAVVLSLLFAWMVLRRAPRATANRVYLTFGFALALWNLGAYHCLISDDEESAVFWAQLAQVAGFFSISSLLHLGLLVAGFQVNRAILLIYALPAALAFVAGTGLLIQDVRWLEPTGWSGVAGPGFPIAYVPLGLLVGSILLLLRRRTQLLARPGRPLSGMIAAQVLIGAASLNDLLPIVGLDGYPLTDWPFLPVSSVATTLAALIAAYSVLHFYLVEVQLTLSRVAADFIRFAVLFGTAAALLLFVAVLSRTFTETAFALALLAALLSALIAAVLFPQLSGGADREHWERRLLGDRFAYQDRVREFIASMVWYQDLPILLNDVHDHLLRAFHMESCRIILRDEINRGFTLFRPRPEELPLALPELKTPSPVFRFFEWGKADYLTLNAAYLRPAASALERQALSQLASFDGEFCFPLASQSEPFGLFIVGRKLSGQPYTSSDITLLTALVKNLSLMVNQIRLKNHLLEAQELDLLGRMSRGMAHDLNNLLTPVWTLLQLSNEAQLAGTPNTLDEELLPTALHNLQTMRAYIKEALFFSENLRPDFQPGRLDQLVAQAADLARASRAKAVKLVVANSGQIQIEMDSVLIQRLVVNIIANAIDATPAGSTISVEILRLEKTEAARDWLRVQVVDEGEGIRKEDLGRIFTPYFTTKNHGDETRGFGLGLAICRKIANLHQGNVTIASQPKKGTTVQIDLPDRQIAPAAVRAGAVR